MNDTKLNKEIQSTEQETKSTEFACIVWTESLVNYDKMPCLWEQILDEKFAKWGHSPLHDKDIYTEKDEFEHQQRLQKQLDNNEISKYIYSKKLKEVKSGELKKAHFHIYVKMKKRVSRKIVQNILEEVGGR